MKTVKTLADFESQYGIRLFSEGVDCVNCRVYVSPSEELLQLVFEWSANEDCTNKYVESAGMGCKSFPEETQFYRYEFENGELMTVGLIGNSSAWEYLGFCNLKYGIELSFSNREMDDMQMYI